MFDINLHPSLEKGQLTPTVNEMAADAFVLLSAGTSTVSLTMVVITWALLNNPQMTQRLKAELNTVIAGRDDTTDWAGLEQLLYLVSKGLEIYHFVIQVKADENKGAVIKEGPAHLQKPRTRSTRRTFLRRGLLRTGDTSGSTYPATPLTIDARQPTPLYRHSSHPAPTTITKTHTPSKTPIHPGPSAGFQIPPATPGKPRTNPFRSQGARGGVSASTSPTPSSTSSSRTSSVVPRS